MSEVAVPAALGGERIDRVVALVSGRSRSEVARLIEQGAVRVSGRAVESRHQRVETGDLLEIDEAVFIDTPPSAPAPEAVSFAVVYADEDIIVVDKPAGLVVHPGAGHERGTLVAGLLERFADLERADIGDVQRPGIVHRLDKDTSGLLVVARSPRAYESLVAQLGARTMGRTYEAVCVGHLEADTGLIDAPIGRSQRDRTRMAVEADGREARTRYEVLERYDLPVAVTRLEAKLETGRTHQIRVHFSAIGHPVAGDVRYGGKVGPLGLKRPFLHAKHLSLVHPGSGEEVEFASSLPEDLTEVLARLGEEASEE